MSISITLLGALALTTGVTISSYLFGSHSQEYFIAIIVGILLLAPRAVRTLSKRRGYAIVVIALIVAPILLWVLQSLFIERGPTELSSLAYSIALGVTVFGAIGVGSLPEAIFRKTMFIVALSHIAISLFALSDINAIILEAQISRFAGEGFRTAVWAEIALGTVVGAVLSRNTLLILVSALVGAFLIFITQMRGAGISMFILLAIYFWMTLGRFTLARWVIPVSLLLMFVFLSFNFSSVLNKFSSLLLLDDPHRGIASGLSGRFENLSNGMNAFLSSPIIGVGVEDYAADYTHNGIIKLLAQYGFVFFTALIYIYIKSLVYSIRRLDAGIISALISYALFILTAPRYINLQIMPFLGIVAVAFAILSQVKNRATPYRSLPKRGFQSLRKWNR